MKFKILRGQRLLQWLLEDSSFPDLEQEIRRGFPQTQKRQHATGPVAITRLNYVPYVDSNSLRVEGTATSSGKRYNPIILFSNVQFTEEDRPSITTFRAADRNEYHIEPVQLRGSNVKVKCDCLDFYWRFSHTNAGDSSLYGDPRPPYNPVGNRPPANPMNVPGVCKHLIKLAERLRRAKVVV